jgi:hypothetical protein
VQEVLPREFFLFIDGSPRERCIIPDVRTAGETVGLPRDTIAFKLVGFTVLEVKICPLPSLSATGLTKKICSPLSDLTTGNQGILPRDRFRTS